MYMKLKSLTAICFTLVLIALMPAVAQNAKKPQGRNSLTGKVIDSRSNEPLPYVSVALMTSGQKSSVVNGGITDDSGVFNIKNIN